ncbi:MAG: ATP-dependent protease ATPase subunit HslU [Planctomycetota bacterium]|nr:ATP-dependent protease ATPase subunit HslU [Planctomycetota bacterium]
MTPREIVAELDKHVVGQDAAKKAVAIALRNRWRRRRLDPSLRDEVAPKNIMMIGPTGVGKTEIARRLAALAGAPFLKVEASRYTEVGYHGRDVESMVRDLVKVAISQAQARARAEVEAKASEAVEERLLDLLLPRPSAFREKDGGDPHSSARDKLRRRLRRGELESHEVELEVAMAPEGIAGLFGAVGGEELGLEMQEALGRMMPKRTRKRRTTVAEARRIVLTEEQDKLVDQDAIARDALDAAQNLGIIFIDEIDKIVSSGREHGPDVSREGVQRDLLPIVEGTTVVTRYGVVRTDHILFIATGAFHQHKPSDLLPELQGRFPIRVELNDLTEDDFARILTVPQNALTRQYTALIETEGVKLEFAPDAIRAIARAAARANRIGQNIGARRLHTVMEKLLEDISFEAPERKGETITVDEAYVSGKMEPLLKDEDLTRYIL